MCICIALCGARGQGPTETCTERVAFCHNRSRRCGTALLPQPHVPMWDSRMTAGERVCETHSAATLSLGTGTSGDDPGAFTSLWRGGPWLTAKG